MAVLNFPSNPTLNQVYSFNGKTWTWNGQGWALNKFGAINGVVIGNVVPEEGTFTNFFANSAVTRTLEVEGLVTANRVATSGSISATGNITTNASILTNKISASGSVVVGTLSTTGNIAATYFYGNGAFLTGISAGGSGNAIANGTSNVSIPIENGNILVYVSNNNVVKFATNGLYVNGLISASGNVSAGNLSVAGNTITSNLISYGSISTSNITATSTVTGSNLVATGTVSGNVISASGNVLAGNVLASAVSAGTVTGTTVSATGNVKANGIAATGNITTTGNINAAGNIYAPNFYGNVIGNISGNLIVPGGNTQVVYNNNGTSAASPAFTFNQASNVVSVTGNVVANVFNGSGVGLLYAMVDRGGDPNNWNTLFEMGTYTVNRVNWGGVTGPPLDSLIYVGLLTVSASNTVPGVNAVQQVFAPGAQIDVNNIKVQYVRNYWSGTWSPWVKMVNDVQLINGGSF